MLKAKRGLERLNSSENDERAPGAVDVCLQTRPTEDLESSRSAADCRVSVGCSPPLPEKLKP